MDEAQFSPNKTGNFTECQNWMEKQAGLDFLWAAFALDDARQKTPFVIRKYHPKGAIVYIRRTGYTFEVQVAREWRK